MIGKWNNTSMAPSNKEKNYLERICFLSNDKNGKIKFNILYVNIPWSRPSQLNTKINALFKECRICKKKVNLNRIENHTKICLKNLEKPIDCFYCTVKFTTKKTLQKHLRKYHANMGILR